MATNAASDRVRFADTRDPKLRLPTEAEIEKALEAFSAATGAALDLTCGVRTCQAYDDTIFAPLDDVARMFYFLNDALGQIEEMKGYVGGCLGALYSCVQETSS